jgi:alpha-L-rhamnosidase
MDYQKIIICPNPPTSGSHPDHVPINWVKAHYDAIHGHIVGSWRRAENTFDLVMEIPANTTATMYLPAGRMDALTESGIPLTKVVGVKWLRWENIRAVLAVQAEKYHFVSKSTP